MISIKLIVISLIAIHAINEVKAKVPSVELVPKVKEVFAGERVKIRCVLSSGSLPVEFEWLKNDQPLIVTSSISIQNLEDLSNIVFENIMSNDTGKYKCLARNSHGQESGVMEMLVKGIF